MCAPTVSSWAATLLSLGKNRILSTLVSCPRIQLSLCLHASVWLEGTACIKCICSGYCVTCSIHHALWLLVIYVRDTMICGTFCQVLLFWNILMWKTLDFEAAGWFYYLLHKLLCVWVTLSCIGLCGAAGFRKHLKALCCKEGRIQAIRHFPIDAFKVQSRSVVSGIL